MQQISGINEPTLKIITNLDNYDGGGDVSDGKSTASKSNRHFEEWQKQF